jgi:hypothetical protein
VYCCVQPEKITLCEHVPYLNVGTLLIMGFFMWKVFGDSLNVLSRLYISVVAITSKIKDLSLYNAFGKSPCN